MAKKRPTRKRYLEARKILRTAGGSFYYDVVGNNKGNPKRYMRVKNLSQHDAYELYARMLNYFDEENVALYRSRDIYMNYQTYPDTVRVTLTPYWEAIKQ